MQKLRYLLATHGRFHYFELAKILYERNQLHKIISGYPWFKLKREKIPKSFVNCFGLFSILNFLHQKMKYQNQSIIDNINILNSKNIDRIALKNINEADVFLSLSQTGLNTGKEMKKSNKIYICDRNSAHILVQQEILSNEYRLLNLPKFKINQWFIDRELKEYEESDVILVPSSFVKKSFEKFYTKKVKVINFPNYQRFHPVKKVKKNQKFFDILFIGSLSIRKGLHYLIEAFHQFNHPNKRLHIVGRHTEDKNFFSRKLMHDKIFIHGFVDNLKMREIINNSDVCVLPSLEDGFGMTPLQAMSCGCPVIVSENTGSADIIRENKCGFIVPIRNSKAIAEKFTLLVDNKELLNEFSNNAFNITKNNNWDHYTDKLNDLILEFKKNKF